MAQQQTVMPQEMMQQPPPPHPQAMHPPINSYYPDNNNDLTGGLPINLDSLRDGPPGSKPFYPYSTLIRYAIKGAPNQKLLLEDIYYAIESRFPYFRTAPPGWKNSVRHNLSLNPCFEKVPRPLTDRGKGSYWTVNDNVDPRTGVHRVRKKKKGSGSKQSQNQQQLSQGQVPIEEDVDYHPDAGTAAFPDPNAQYVPPQAIDPNTAGPSRQPAYQPAYPTPFDPNFPMMAPTAPPPPNMRYPPMMFPDEGLPYDEHGNVDWHNAWRTELSNLTRMTEDQEKAGNQEWFRQMWWRLRAMMTHPGDPLMPGMQGAPPPGHPHGMPQPPNPGEVPQE